MTENYQNDRIQIRRKHNEYFHADSFDSNNITHEGVLVIPRTDGTEERIDLHPYARILIQYGEQNEKTSLSRELQNYETGSYLLHFDHIAVSRAEDGSVVWDSASG